MGKLSFGKESLRLDDRTLAHLEAVFVAKLRRHEGFMFTWWLDISLGSGRVSKWVHPACNFRFRFDSLHSPITRPG